MIICKFAVENILKHVNYEEINIFNLSSFILL